MGTSGVHENWECLLEGSSKHSEFQGGHMQPPYTSENSLVSGFHSQQSSASVGL